MEVQLDPLVDLMQQYLDWDEEKTSEPSGIHSRQLPP
jgi:hypothetical protein